MPLANNNDSLRARHLISRRIMSKIYDPKLAQAPPQFRIQQSIRAQQKLFVQRTLSPFIKFRRAFSGQISFFSFELLITTEYDR